MIEPFPAFFPEDGSDFPDWLGQRARRVHGEALRSIAGGEVLSADEAMQVALNVAAAGAGRVAPNPLVGAVVLDREGRFLGAGAHRFVGGPHAEIDALAAALRKVAPAQFKNLKSPTASAGVLDFVAHVTSASEKMLRTCQMIVTLEPCAHIGRTPSCAEALARIQPSRVVYGLKDPHPQVSGKGAEILRAAGVETQLLSSQVLQRDCAELAEIFVHSLNSERVFLTLKLAQSLDGRIALASGDSQWITGEEARRAAHRLRREHDMVAVGAQTVMIDDPRLTIRLQHLEIADNLVLVVDPRGQTLDSLLERRIFQDRSPEKIWIAVGHEAAAQNSRTIAAIKQAGARVWIAPALPEFSWADLLKDLRQHGMTSLLVEGGGATARRLLRTQLIDRLHLFTAPLLIGCTGRDWSPSLDLPHLSAAPRWTQPRVRMLGEDIHWTARRS